MPVHTHLLSFEGLQNHLVKSNVQTVIEEIHKILQTLKFRKVHSYEEEINSDLGFLVLFVADDGRHASLRGYPIGGLLTLDLHEYIPHDPKTEDTRLTDAVIEELETSIRTLFENTKDDVIGLRSKIFPAIRRGEEVDVYYPLVDGRIIEYDFTEVLFRAKSEYQDIVIAHSESFGNVLILDGDVNLAESDVVYSRTMMQSAVHSYADKTCLILGGGDGGLLHEILKEKPKMVTMVDVDEVVVKAAKVHLRGICFDSLDEYVGPNHEVIIADAIPLLKSYAQQGRTFDYVLYDLTAVPIKSETYAGDEWQFHRMLHNLSLAVLAPDGFYFAQANALRAKESLRMYDNLLQTLDAPVNWKKHEAFVPSYHEIWVFYEVWKTSSEKRQDRDNSQRHLL